MPSLVAYKTKQIKKKLFILWRFAKKNTILIPVWVYLGNIRGSNCEGIMWLRASKQSWLLLSLQTRARWATRGPTGNLVLSARFPYNVAFHNPMLIASGPTPKLTSKVISSPSDDDSLKSHQRYSVIIDLQVVGFTR